MDDNLVMMYCCMAPNCSKTYSAKFNLKRHVDTQHLRVRHFVCEHCQHEFASKQNLEEHLYLHSGFKPYVCSHCGLHFRQASQFSLHKRTHISTGAEDVEDVTHAIARLN